MYNKEQQTYKKRIKLTQKQKGNISEKVRNEVKERSIGLCEYCKLQHATQMAHIISRKQINHKTTAKDLLHVCIACHIWLDQTPEGIQFKRRLVSETHILDDHEIS